MRERDTVAAGRRMLEGRAGGRFLWSPLMGAVLEEVTALIRVLGKAVPLRLLCLVWTEELCVEFCARVTGVDEAQVSRGFGELWEAGAVRRRPEGRWVFYQRVRGRAHPVLWQFLRLTRSMGLGTLEVRQDRRLVEQMRRGEGGEKVADLPWPKRDGARRAVQRRRRVASL